MSFKSIETPPVRNVSILINIGLCVQPSYMLGLTICSPVSIKGTNLGARVSLIVCGHGVIAAKYDIL